MSRIRRCAFCGGTFESRRGAKLCSDACRKAYSKEQKRRLYHERYSAAARNPSIKKECRWCGNQFEVKRYASRRLYCSERCAERARKAAEKAKERIDRYRRRRHERFQHQIVERFSYRDIARRDGWKCHLCGKPINPRLKWPHPMAPTFDHLIPIAAGGLHVRSNVRLAHFICNARRSNIGPAQLFLDIAG